MECGTCGRGGAGRAVLQLEDIFLRCFLRNGIVESHIVSTVPGQLGVAGRRFAIAPLQQGADLRAHWA